MVKYLATQIIVLKIPLLAATFHLPKKLFSPVAISILFVSVLLTPSFSLPPAGQIQSNTAYLLLAVLSSSLLGFSSVNVAKIFPVMLLISRKNSLKNRSASSFNKSIRIIQIHAHNFSCQFPIPYHNRRIARFFEWHCLHGTIVS